jgi:hypothetical protein
MPMQTPFLHDFVTVLTHSSILQIDLIFENTPQVTASRAGPDHSNSSAGQITERKNPRP